MSTLIGWGDYANDTDSVDTKGIRLNTVLMIVSECSCGKPTPETSRECPQANELAVMNGLNTSSFLINSFYTPSA